MKALQKLANPSELGPSVRRMKFLLAQLATLGWLSAAAAPIADEPFWQDVAVRIRHAPELTNAIFKKLYVDKENGVYVLTDRGVARVFEIGRAHV